MSKYNLCDYGCGKPAKHRFKNGKWCCEDFFTKCSNFKPKIKRSGKDHGMFNKHHTQEVKDRNREITNNFTLFENLENILCDYGCGKEAKYILNNGKYCCNGYTVQCTNIIKRTIVGGFKNKLTFDKYKLKHPKLFEVEEIRENNGIIEVKCKFCRKWFNPKYEQLRARIGCIENKIRKENCYFFCSENCKIKSPDYLSGLRKDPVEVKNLNSYREEVIRLTGITTRKNKNKIKFIELRGKKFKKALDHKFSVIDGFKNNVDPKIMANINNLEIIDESLNNYKRGKSSITLEELLKTYEE
jgi:hypothetical protein